MAKAKEAKEPKEGSPPPSMPTGYDPDAGPIEPVPVREETTTPAPEGEARAAKHKTSQQSVRPAQPVSTPHPVKKD